MVKSSLSEKINIFTQGLVNTASELMLLSICYNFTFELNDINMVDPEEKIAIEAFKKIPMKTIRRSLRHLRAKGLVAPNPDPGPPFILTNLGHNYLNSIIADYQHERPWEGRLYLVTYDVPRTNNRERNALREFLKQLGAGLLQHSVWVLPNNPQAQIEEFKNLNKINNSLIVISSFDAQGGVIGKSLSDVASETFKISAVNEAYQKFLTKHTLPCARERLIFLYLNALKLDPQLPFNLYPANWQGQVARSHFEQLL